MKDLEVSIRVQWSDAREREWRAIRRAHATHFVSLAVTSVTLLAALVATLYISWAWTIPFMGVCFTLGNWVGRCEDRCGRALHRFEARWSGVSDGDPPLPVKDGN